MGMILTVADAMATQRMAKEEQDAKKKYKPKKNAVGATVTVNSGKAFEGEKDNAEHWLNLHGGKNLTHTIATARRFIFRQGMPIHIQEFRAAEQLLLKKQQEQESQAGKPTWEDGTIKVWAMVVEPETPVGSPRKRTHAEYAAEIPSHEVAISDQDDQDDQLRKGVVAEMFDSSWRLDALTISKLSAVRMPAQIFVRREGKIEKYTGPMVGDEDDVPDIDVLVRKPWPGAMIESLPSTTPCKDSVCYIIRNYPQRGKFNPVVAKELGVLPRQNAALTRGESVVTAAGVTVAPEQVISPGTEGNGFAVIDLPDRSYVAALIGRKEWSSPEIMNGVGGIFWILGPGVVEDTRLETFMKEHPEMKHVVSSSDVCANNLALESPAAAAVRLHFIDPERYPVPAYSNTASIKRDASTPHFYDVARPGKKLQLQPKLEIKDDAIVPYLDLLAVNNEALTDKAVQDLAAKAQEVVTNKGYLEKLAQTQEDIPCKDAEVITLGTGSALPSKYRNVSATLLRVPGYGSYLFDCGENTLGQLKRVFGGKMPEVLRDLKAIWISHLHADHHLGTTSVIRAWNEATKNDDLTKNNTLLVTSDIAMLSWLKEYSEVEHYGYERIQPLPMGSQPSSSARNGRTFRTSYTFTTEETAQTGLSKISTCFVQHCNAAMAVVIDFPNGFKVAYSGDCRPSQEFVAIGQGATLLIHEATFDDELIGDAMAKKHSTTSEALQIGKAMGARRILLTHFSQRYQKIPVMAADEGKDQIAIVAFDYMRTRIGDFAKVESFKPALMKLYEDSDGN
jgi:ribonuclease Z